MVDSASLCARGVSVPAENFSETGVRYLGPELSKGESECDLEMIVRRNGRMRSGGLLR